MSHNEEVRSPAWFCLVEICKPDSELSDWRADWRAGWGQLWFELGSGAVGIRVVKISGVGLELGLLGYFTLIAFAVLEKIFFEKSFCRYLQSCSNFASSIKDGKSNLQPTYTNVHLKGQITISSLIQEGFATYLETTIVYLFIFSSLKD